MTITRGIAAAATFAAVAVGTASPAWADPATMSGHYVGTETNPRTGQTLTADWYFTPCGDGCASVAIGGTGAAPLQARLVNGQWTMDTTDSAARCPDGTQVPNAEAGHWTWDPNTLAGTVQFTDKFAVCGFSAPISYTNNIQLRQAPMSNSGEGH